MYAVERRMCPFTPHPDGKRKEEHTQLKKGRTHTHKRKYNAIIVERRRKKENEFQTFVIPSV
jgi:hypothetical protein